MPVKNLLDGVNPEEKKSQGSLPEEELKEISSSHFSKGTDLKLINYLIKNKDIVEAWAKAHSKEPELASTPPIYYDHNLEDFVWMNRKQRRQALKQAKRQSKS